MDRIDRKILFDLYNNCRISYQELASKHKLTVSAVWRRVQQLEKQGIINHFAVEISPDKIQIYQMLTIVTVDGSVDEQALVKNLSEIEFITSISTIINRTSIVLLEAPEKNLLSQSVKRIESITGVFSIDAYRIGSWLEAWEGNIEDDKGMPSFSPEQIEVLRVLYESPRASLNELKQQLDYPHRRVKRILDEIIESKSIIFTIRVSVQSLNVLQKISYNAKTTPEEVMKWFGITYPDKYLWTFTGSERNTAFSQFAVDSFDEADKIRADIKKLEGVDIVETLISRSSTKLPRFRAKLLEDMIKGNSTS